MVLAEQMSKALKSLVACVDKRSPVAAEKSLLLTADGEQLTLRASSSKGSLSLSIPAAIELEPIGVPFAALEKAVKAAEDGELEMSQQKDRLVVENDRRKIRLRTISASSFSHDLPDDLFSAYATTNGGELSSALLRAVRVASEEGGTLGAISIEGGSEKIKIAATDRLRLFFCPIEAHSEDTEQILINRDSCKLLAGAIKGVEDIELLKSDEAIRFRYGLNLWTLPRLHGNFPRFDDLIPQEGNRLLVDSEQLAGALKGVAAVARSGTLDPNSHIPIRLWISEESAKLRYKDSELGDMEEELPNVSFEKGESQEIGFNGAFLADMLLALANPEGLVNSPDEAVLFFDGAEKYLLMPVRLASQNGESGDQDESSGNNDQSD